MLKRIQTKLLVFFAVIFLIYLLQLFFKGYRVMDESDTMYQIHMEDKNKIFDKLIILQGKSLAMFAYDYTYWDEMVEFVKSGDKDWAYENIEMTMPSFQANAVWIYKPDFTLLYSNNNLGIEKLNRSQFSADTLKSIFEKNYFSHFFLSTDYGIFEFRTAPIQSTNDYERKGNPQGYFITAKIWDQNFLNELSDIIDGPALIIPVSENINQRIDSAYKSGNSIYIEKPLKSISGTPAAILKITQPVFQYENQVNKYLKIEIYTFLVFSLVFIAGSIFVIIKWVGIPLKKLTRSLQNENTEIISDIKNSNNEFGLLASLIIKHKKAEQSLIDIKERYKAIFERSMDIAYLHDFEGRFIDANTSALKLLGYDKSEIKNLTFTEILEKDDLEKALKNVKEIIEKGFQQENSVFRIKHKSGKIFIIEVKDSLIYQDGKPYAILGLGRDITEKSRNEEIIKENQRRLATLMSNLPGMAYRCKNDKNWSMEFVSEGCKALTGYNDTDIVNNNRRSFSELICLEDRNYVWNEVQNSLNRKEPFELVYRIKTADNIIKWVWEKGRGISSENGELIALEGFISDITEQRMNQESIAKARDFYLTLFDEFPTMIWRSGKNSVTDYYNKTWLKFRGAALEEELKHGWAETVCPVDLPHAALVNDNAFRDRKPFRVEYRIKHHSGVYKWIADVGRPYYDIDGNFAGYIGTCIDIDEQKKLEESLMVSTEHYKNLFESAHDSIIIFTPDKEIILDANKQACNMYGYPKEELIGMSLEKFSVNIARGKELIEYTIKNKYVQSMETVHMNRNGEKMYVESNGAVINYKNQTAIIAINRNITAKKETEEKIRASLKEKEVLLKEVHHRVKNNLQVISSLLKLQSEYIRDGLDLELFRESQNRVKTMALIHEKLYRSKELSRIDIRDYIDNLTTTLVSTYGINRKKIKLINNSEKVFFDIDTAIPCGLIVNELISNSLKHAFGENETGKITISLRTEGPSKYKLVVGDNGNGIPENIDFRNTKTLGLQLVITLTEQLEGSVNLISGKGTKFEIVFSEVKYKERNNVKL